MGRGFSAHPSTLHSHASKVSQRGGQVSSYGQKVGGSGPSGSAFGGVGASTLKHSKTFSQTTSGAMNKAGSKLYGQSDLLHKTGNSYADVEDHNAAKFHGLKKSNTVYGKPKGYPGQGGGSSKPNYGPPQSPWANKAWFGNRKYQSSGKTQDDFAHEYGNYWPNRDHVKYNVRPYHPEYDKIDTADLVGVRGYTTNDYYKKVNTALRTGDGKTVYQYEPHIKTAVSGLNQMPRYNGETVRKIQLDNKQDLNNVLNKYKPGRTVQEDTFVSTTMGKTNSFPGNVVMHINSRTGHPIANLSKYPTEGEVLFGPGTKFNVNDRWYDQKSNAWHINMTEAK